jgi:hypothetical protein
MAAALAGLALLGADPRGARAQEPEKTAPRTPAAGSDQPLSLRYRFAEKYSLAEDANRPELLWQYQVGMDETYRIEIERPQGAPQQQGLRQRTIYTERPARLGRLGDVTDTVRRYDRYEPLNLDGARQADPRAASLFRDLTLWYRLPPARDPEVISLTPNRPLREPEYEGVLTQLFLPRLKAILPSQPVRVADTWPIARQGVQALLAKSPGVGEIQLDATLAQVDKATQGTELTAIIDVSGKVALKEGDVVVRARISFVFEPPATAPAAEPAPVPARAAGVGARRDVGVVEATGYIAKVQMRRLFTTPVEGEPRLQQTVTRDLVLHRRRATGLPGAAAAEALVVPDQPPTADANNSWLVYDDPERRFHFRHPQQLADAKDPDGLVLQYVRPEGKADTVIIAYVPREADAVHDRKWSDPQAFVKDLQQNATKRGHNVVNGSMGFLPDQDWTPLNRRVYRYEAALKAERSGRVYLDAYLVLFSRGDHFVVQAMTDRDDHVEFRNQVERLIRSLELGPSTPGQAGAPARPQPGPPSATAPTPGTTAPVGPPGRTP